MKPGFVLGNGRSRLEISLDDLKKHGRVYGCNALYRDFIPDVLIATIEPPTGINVQGRGCLIQARLCRPKRAESRGDQQAKEVSDGKLLYLLRFFKPITLTALLSPYSYVG